MSWLGSSVSSGSPVGHEVKEMHMVCIGKHTMWVAPGPLSDDSRLVFIVDRVTGGTLLRYTSGWEFVVAYVSDPVASH